MYSKGETVTSLSNIVLGSPRNLEPFYIDPSDRTNGRFISLYVWGRK